MQFSYIVVILVLSSSYRRLVSCCHLKGEQEKGFSPSNMRQVKGVKFTKTC